MTKKRSLTVIPNINSQVQMIDPSLKVKACVLGKSMVGKTSLVQALLGNPFKKEVSSTVGYTNAIITLQKRDEKIRLDVWDTAGQEKYKSLVGIYLRDSNIIIIVSDSTDTPEVRESEFNSFYQLAIQTVDEITTHFVYVSTKMDLCGEIATDEREVIYVSSKTGENIDLLKSKLLDICTEIDCEEEIPLLEMSKRKCLCYIRVIFFFFSSSLPFIRYK